MKNITKLFKCGKCDEGIVKRTLKETKTGVDIKMYKCDNKKCKYHYGLKEVNSLTMISEAGTE
jgi:hypothetical protein